ncbi:bifunctional 2-polyprenyl-6-hydroxyphenol methylase/3-demethylubiquinol 3-O-methyltransferase UbiG [Paucisalibacillus sp. EB02]|uniref:class I SAM-dependent methyltransferase n=1 Tax=Paucisalibacillus sp. EB02 TaxID=1347087 RepID=UPI0004ADA5E0|nr:class I SAM-dependent methyltransferase [Paucisalibacillus sp. EB02]
MGSFNWKEKSKEEWNNRADFWSARSQSMWDHGSRKDIVPLLDKHLDHRATVVDVGCGDGYGTFKLHTLGHEVMGVDISEEMIKLARTRLQEVPFQVADVNQLPLADKSVDAILSINVLEWVEVPATALKEIHRVIKPDGILCVGILGPTAGPRSSSYPKVFGEKSINNTMMPWEFFKLAKELGFSLVDELGVYKEGVREEHHQDLPVVLKQALSFMWVFLLRKVGE